MRYYIIAGEASGDLHGANLMRALREKDPQAEFRFWGGDAMAAVGGTPVRHDLSKTYNISKERVRQIELNSIKKISKAVGVLQ